MIWHYFDGTEQKGPISDADLTRLEGEGAINGHTLVWREGMADWQPYSQVRPSVASAASLPVAAAPPVLAPGTVTCAECGRVFPVSEVVQLSNVSVCADCKPVFLQKLREGVAPKGVMNYAGFLVRGGSIILDGILMYVIILPTDFLMARSMGGRAGYLNFLVNTLIGVTCYTFFLGTFGATPGKMANKLLVVNPDGSKISYGKAFGRYFASNYISGIFTLFIGYLLAIWDDEKRALHDRICSTRVIRKP
jgi:uncharacterized RDD family membrane protein YckC